MKCLVFSDSHSYYYNMARALKLHRDAEVVFFLGDGLSDIDYVSSELPNAKFLAVRGNCDMRRLALGVLCEKTEMIEIMGKRIVYTHGDLYGAKYGTAGLEMLALEKDADIVLYGHTHIPATEYISDYEKPFYLFNPGCIGSSCGTYGILTLTEGAEPLFSHGNFL